MLASGDRAVRGAGGRVRGRRVRAPFRVADGHAQRRALRCRPFIDRGAPHRRRADALVVGGGRRGDGRRRCAARRSLRRAAGTWSHDPCRLRFGGRDRRSYARRRHRDSWPQVRSHGRPPAPSRSRHGGRSRRRVRRARRGGVVLGAARCRRRQLRGRHVVCLSYRAGTGGHGLSLGLATRARRQSDRGVAGLGSNRPGRARRHPAVERRRGRHAPHLWSTCSAPCWAASPTPGRCSTTWLPGSGQSPHGRPADTCPTGRRSDTLTGSSPSRIGESKPLPTRRPSRVLTSASQSSSGDCCRRTRSQRW